MALAMLCLYIYPRLPTQPTNCFPTQNSTFPLHPQVATLLLSIHIHTTTAHAT